MSRSCAGWSLDTGSLPVRVRCMPGLATLRGPGDDGEATLLLEFVRGGREDCVFEYVGGREIDGDDGAIDSL